MTQDACMTPRRCQVTKNTDGSQSIAEFDNDSTFALKYTNIPGVQENEENNGE